MSPAIEMIVYVLFGTMIVVLVGLLGAIVIWICEDETRELEKKKI